jgi:hypothetical protein
VAAAAREVQRGVPAARGFRVEELRPAVEEQAQARHVAFFRRAVKRRDLKGVGLGAVQHQGVQNKNDDRNGHPKKNRARANIKEMILRVTQICPMERGGTPRRQ